MKILLISPLPPPNGGDATWTEKILKYFNLLNLNVAHVNTSIIGKRAITLSYKINYVHEFSRLFRIWYSTVKILMKFRPDVVHLASNCSPRGIFRDFGTILLVKLMNIKLVLHCHSNVYDSIGKSLISIAFLRSSVNFAAEVLVLNIESEKYVNSLRKRGCNIVPNFIENGFVLNEKIIRDNVEDILFVGHLVKTKGVLEFVEVAKRFPYIRFTMAGILSDEINVIKLPENVYLVGDVENAKVMELLDCADVFLLPTYTEGFSIAILEAMSRGLPIITTPVGSNKEMLELNGAILVPVGDVDGISEAIKKLECPVVRKDMSKWNINKVRNCYTASAVINRLINLYGNLIRPSRHGN